jgi:hypothetical protein
MADPDDPIGQSTERFLAGHMSDELERHCRNVGRIAVEFACLEEHIGKVRAALDPGARASQDYMKHVDSVGAISRAFKELKRSTVLNIDAADIEASYWRFKKERDRFAHAAVGSMMEQRADGVQELKMNRLKHAKSAAITDLPSDDEADKLVREIRAEQLKLFFEPSRLMLLHANQRSVDAAKHAIARIAEAPGRAARDAFARLWSD